MTPILPDEPIATSPFEPPVAYVALSERYVDRRNLHAQEADALGPRAGTRRRAEFTLGRAAAATALVRLGLDPPPPILRGPQGEPMWPDGVIGSISHCCGWAVAVATTQPPCIAIGVDIEKVSDVAGLDGRPVCTPRELRWSDERPGETSLRLALILSAKETLFKALFPLQQQFIEFRSVELSWSNALRSFRVELLDHALKPISHLPLVVRCSRDGDIVRTHLFVGTPPT